MTLHFESNLENQIAAIEALEDLLHGLENCRTKKGELEESATCKEYLQVQQKGRRHLPHSHEIFHQHRLCYGCPTMNENNEYR
jgi:hypothetical protein